MVKTRSKQNKKQFHYINNMYNLYKCCSALIRQGNGDKYICSLNCMPRLKDV